MGRHVVAAVGEIAEGVERHDTAVGGAKDHGERVEGPGFPREQIGGNDDGLQHESTDQRPLDAETVGDEAAAMAGTP